MRICYVSSILSIHDERFFDKFIEKGHDVHVVSLFSTKKITREGIKFYYNNLGVIPGFKKKNLFIIKAINYIYMMIKATIRLKKILRNIQPDILHGGWVENDGFICAATGFHPFLLMPWGSDILIAPKLSIFHKIIAKYTIRKSDMITCDCESMKNEINRLSGYPKDRIITFPWGIDLKKFNPNINGLEIRNKLGWGQDKKILITVSYLKKIYGIEYLLHSVPFIINEVPETRVIICGDGELKEDLVQWVKSNGLREYVYFAGHVPNEELPKYYNAADIFIYTPLSSGSSLALLEAMACGLPVVASSIPALMEWIRDGYNGFIVPVKDSKVLAEKIVKLLKDNDIAIKFGNNNIQIAKEKADWDKNFEKLEMIYNTLANYYENKEIKK